MVIISNLYAHTKVLPILDMNAGTVQCKCGVHYTARDPHPLCRNCSTRGCSRSLPCSYCIPLSYTECDLWQDQEAKTRACGSKRISEESSSPATEGLGSLQDVNSNLFQNKLFIKITLAPITKIMEYFTL